MIRRVLALSIAIAAGSAGAEQLYVGDKLVLNVYAEADQSSERVAQIETGDTVEELERTDNFIHVRLADGREGWVGANYLSAQPPAIVRLKTLQSEQPADSSSDQKALHDEVARLQKQNASLQSELAALKQQAAATPAVAPTAAPAAAPSDTPAAAVPAEPEEEPATMTPPAPVSSDKWWLWPLLLIVGTVGGFVAGYQTLARYIRSKYGGVKVY